MKKFNRALCSVLAVVMVLSCAVLSGAANITFTDVSGHWAWTGGQIPYLVDKEVLNGYKNSDGTYYFKPDGEVTRAEFIKMLDEAFGLTATAGISYEDISKDDWYYTYFAKAAAQGYLINYGTKASPNSKISRQEATALLVRYLDLPAATQTQTGAIADYAEISGYFNDYVLRAIDAGIINGYNIDGKMYFKPTQTLTRAEALTILYRAAGCIYNNSAYNRDADAYSTNNTVTRGDITVNNITMNGRNIIAEGADSGIVTFNKCTINGTLYIRGAASVTFDNCKADNVVVLGGGKVSVVSGSQINTLTVEKTCEVSALSNTKIDTIIVKNGCGNVNVTGNGSIRAAYIYADGFSSAMVPEEFEIGNNLTASFGGVEYAGSSDAQLTYSIDPFITTDGTYYYVNLESSVGGELYYYYTSNATTPSISSFSSSWSNANNADSTKITAGEAVSIQTFTADKVKNYSYLVLQLQDGTKKYPVVMIDNSSASESTGFQAEPYLDSSTAVKFKSSISGSVMWYYTDNGTSLTQLSFLSGYDKQSSALRGEVTVTPLMTGTVTLKETYSKNYSYVALMLKSSTGNYYAPVVLPLDDNGFTTAPSVRTAGIITFKTSVNGTLYYYYSDDASLPTADKFKSEYNAANYHDNIDVTKNTDTELKYSTNYISNYPYLIMALRNSDGDYLLPVAVDINLTTGFKVAPKLDDAKTISFKTEDYGTVYYYYTKDETAPSVDDFTKNYDASQTRYRGSVKCGTTYEYIEFDDTYTITYPYMAIRFTDEDGKNYSPVTLELDSSFDTGFSILPYARDGYVYFSTEDDGEVLYFYSRNADNVDADEFLDWYKSSTYDTVSVKARTLTSFAIDDYVLSKNPYIILAFREEDYRYEDDFYTPYVLDVETSEMTQAGTGLSVTGPDSDSEYRVASSYDGTLYWYRTDSRSDLPSSSRSFEDMYDDTTSSLRSWESMDKDDHTYIKAGDYTYLVLCLKVSGQWLEPVTINTDTGSSSGASFDDGHTKDGYGINSSMILYSDDSSTVYITPYYSGTLRLIAVEDGKAYIVSETACSADTMTSITAPFNLGVLPGLGSIFTDTEFYVQLVTSTEVYEAFKIKLAIG